MEPGAHWGHGSRLPNGTVTGLRIRVALRANPRQVVPGFVMKAMRLSGVGIGIGVVLTLGSFRLIRGALYGVGAAPPIALGFTLALLCLRRRWPPATCLLEVRRSHGDASQRMTNG